MSVRNLLRSAALVAVCTVGIGVYQNWQSADRAHRGREAAESLLASGDAAAAARAQIAALKLPLEAGPGLTIERAELRGDGRELFFALRVSDGAISDAELRSAAFAGACEDPFTKLFLSDPGRRIVKRFGRGDSGAPLVAVLTQPDCAGRP